MNMKAQWFQSVADITETRWKQAIGLTDYPFAQFAFHSSLEKSLSIGGETGWHPEYLLLTDATDFPIAVIPTYLKTHSQGEFVFDWAWADAYQRYGFRYFPKRIWAIPFSPVTGPRIFTHLDPSGVGEASLSLYPQIAALLTDVTKEQGLSSWHLLFAKQVAAESCMSESTMHRVSCQFHWFNRDYKDMDDYLGHFSSRKRKTARKERQKVVQQGLHLVRKLGSDLTIEEVDFFYLCYQTTYAKRGQFGYLTRAFFQHLIDTMPQHILLVLAYQEERPVAASWCFYDQHSLYGRYWGCVEAFDCLHFEACYYQGIEFCLEKGLQHFDPGTQGEHKIARGFEPVLSHSVHYIDHEGFREAIRHFCEEETQAVHLYLKNTTQLLPFKTD